MFYEHIILAKKGPLARIWLAAHWDKKITKAHVFETNIEKSVEGILQPKVKLALRTSGHLLLGVVRIYSRKAKYLLADCNEAFVKIKMAFRPGMVDLPEGHREANINAITLPEVFHDFDTALPEVNDIDIEAQFLVNQSRADEITMREDYGSLSLSLHDDGFGDIGFENDTADVMRDDPNDQMFDIDSMPRVVNEGDAELKISHSGIVTPLDGDGFGDDFAPPDLFQDDLFDEGLATKDTPQKPHVSDIAGGYEPASALLEATSPASSCSNLAAGDNEEAPRMEESAHKETDSDQPAERNDPQVVGNEEESFALAPIDSAANKGVTKTKRKRKLIVDEVKNISGEEMKAQLADTSDIISTLDLAPPTKRLMYWKETGGVEKLFTLPSRSISARVLFNNYRRHLISHYVHVEDFSSFVPLDIMALEQYQNEADLLITSKRGRKRKQGYFVSSFMEEALQDIPAPEQMRNAIHLTSASVDADDYQHMCGSETPMNTSAVFDNVRSPFEISEMAELRPSGVGEPLAQSRSAAELDLQHPQQPDSPTRFADGNVSTWHPEPETSTALPNAPTDDYGATKKGFLSDWNDYDASYVQNSCDEQMENETDEQFEERVLNKRAAQLFYAIRTRLCHKDSLNISELTSNDLKKQAAQKFYSLLVLKKFQAIDIVQSTPYADITITRGALFENAKL